MQIYFVESYIRGYRIYKDAWEASINEEFSCQCDSGNTADLFAAVVVKNGVTVGHIPQKISSFSLCYSCKKVEW